VSLFAGEANNIPLDVCDYSEKNNMQKSGLPEFIKSFIRM